MLELDIAGTATDNLVTGEEHMLGGDGLRVIVPTEGLYFYETMVVYSSAHGRNLVRGTEYRPVAIARDVCIRYAQHIVYGLDFEDVEVSSTLTIQYQALGGDEGQGTADFAALSAAIEDARNAGISWDDIDHPLAFVPADHIHQFQNVSDFEKITPTLATMTRNIHGFNRMGGSSRKLANMDNRILQLMMEMNERINRISGTSSLMGTASQEEVDDLAATVEELQDIAQVLAETSSANADRISTIETQLYQLVSIINENADFEVTLNTGDQV